MTARNVATVSDSREFDVVVFGATGFVGRLTAAYLADHAPAGTRIALAGRSSGKLADVAAGLPGEAKDWPRIVADADSPASLDALAARTRVVLTTVGPYLKYGEALVGACAAAGTDYVDLTGEVPFVRWAIDKHDETARASGARIVHSCGFDSVPSDLGVFALYRRAQAEDAGTLGATTMVVTSLRGGVSGGTIDSMRTIADQVSDPAVRRVLLDPHALTGGPGERTPRRPEANDMAVVPAREVDPSLAGWLAPFFMASHNTRIVRRSSALLADAGTDGYGPGFRYREAMATGRIPLLSSLAAGAVATGTAVGLGAMAAKPLRPLLDRLLPKPGEGPSEKARLAGHFTTKTYTRTSKGTRLVARIHAQGDPGYQATAVMLAQSALTLALDRAELPELFGVLTPAAAMGDALTARLRAAGVEITTSILD